MTADEFTYAHESLTWAEMQIPDLESRLRTWLNANVAAELRDDGDKYLLLIAERQPLPLSFSVEVGAYINAIRSSLDILAVTLAVRHGMAVDRNVRFPVVKDECAFVANSFVKGLPDSVRAIIASFRPYKDGDQIIYDLHQMDITRKHHRLLEVIVRPQTVKILAWGKGPTFTPAAQSVSANGETLLGFVSKDLGKPDVHIEPCVAISERGVSIAVSVLLRHYIRTVRSVLDAFG